MCKGWLLCVHLLHKLTDGLIINNDQEGHLVFDKNLAFGIYSPN